MKRLQARRLLKVRPLARYASFAVRVLSAFLRNRGILLAGGVGYNALLSVVPFFTLVVTALTHFFDEEQVIATLRPELKALVPQHADLILETVKAFLANQAATGAVSVVLLLFFSSLAFRVLEEAVEAIFHRASGGVRRSFWKSALLPYAFIGLAMVSLFVLAIVTIGLDALGDRTLRLGRVEISLSLGTSLLLRGLAVAGLAGITGAIYHVLPVSRVSVRRAMIGGLAAATLWKLISLFLVYYFEHVSKANLIYGSLATVVVLLLFLELAFTILLLGAQVIAELEASAAAGLAWHQDPTSAESSRPLSRAEPG